MDPDRPNISITGPFIGPDGKAARSQDAWEDPDDLLDQARERIRVQDEQNREGVKLARRLIVAFVLVLIMGVVFYAVLPQWGLRLPPIVPVLSFLAILTGAILTGLESSEADAPARNAESRDDGCAVGMCSGPRPLKMFRDPPKKDSN